MNEKSIRDKSRQQGVSLVLFDMDDVLVHYDRSVRVNRLARLSNRTPDEVVHAIWGSGLEAQADAGSIDDMAYLRQTSALLGCTVSLYDWLEARRESMTPNVEVLAFAAEISRRCRIAVLTNNPRLVETHIAGLCPPIAELFGAHVYASASFNAAKPCAEVYLKCVGALGVAPAQTLFIDDLAVNVEGARNAGLLGHQFTGHRLLADELREHRLLDE
ncbi:HAD family hydrolase [Paraburkholderia sp. J63]|uniref:HAD family hydrolase n=1 Tax=Paraburkholderia sp. J63 TaxID=2805434 RepID=UPI0039F62FF0